jgi:hypothetical protein
VPCIYRAPALILVIGAVPQPPGSDLPEPEYRQRIIQTVLADEGFLRLSLSGAKSPCPWRKASVRPVEVRRRRQWQFSYLDQRQDTTQNLDGDAAAIALEELLGHPFTHIHLQSAAADLHVRITKKGRALVSHAKPSRPGAAASLSHNRDKNYLLPPRSDDPLLHVLGILDSTGKVRPTMQDKFRQINQFLNLLAPLVAPQGDLRLIDGGCGSAYLTFAAYHYLRHTLQRQVHATGVDRNAELVLKSEKLRDDLGWDGPQFQAAAVDEFDPEQKPNIVLSLHACDTATDEVIAQGVRWGSDLILAAPCCQHELRPQLERPPFAALRDGILKQRSAEILTDAARAQILRTLGYRTDIVEFIDTQHTPKNLMIRAVKTGPAGDVDAVQAYKELRDFWGITPSLERLLAPQLAPYL